MKYKLNLLNSIYSNVLKYPHKTCIVDGNKDLSYEQFWLKSLMYANYLKNNSLYTSPKVCIFESQTYFDYISMIGTLLAGGYYIPINKLTPINKIKKIIKLTRANFFSSAFITLEEEKKIKIKKICKKIFEKKIEIKKNIKLNNSNLAYILFTSGTTGTPKGVKITKKNLDYYCMWLKKKFNFDNKISCSQIPSIGFDLSVADIYLSLCSGSKLVVADKFDLMFPAKMIFIKRINHLVCTPSLIDYINSSNQLKKKYFKSLKSIFFCGEPLYQSQVEAVFKANPRISIINSYGPTESTVSITYILIKKRNYKNFSNETISIGKTIKNCEILLVDKKMRENKKEGEILISGKQLSPGYHLMPIENKKKFIKFKGKRFYKTGDFAYKYKNNLYFKNRIDHQIKIKGHRVEINEVNSFIRKFGVKNVYTIFDGKKIHSIIEDSKINLFMLDRYLKKNLENYKLPELVNIKKFKLNKNGKVDIHHLKKFISKKYD